MKLDILAKLLAQIESFRMVAGKFPPFIVVCRDLATGHCVLDGDDGLNAGIDSLAGFESSLRLGHLFGVLRLPFFVECFSAAENVGGVVAVQTACLKPGFVRIVKISEPLDLWRGRLFLVRLAVFSLGLGSVPSIFKVGFEIRFGGLGRFGGLVVVKLCLERESVVRVAQILGQGVFRCLLRSCSVPSK